MALVNHNINNLSGGVSQQPPESRFDNQVESMNNFVVTPAQGLRRRNPLQVVNTTGSNHQANMAIHSYDRGDGLSKYGMIIDNSGLRVFDSNGNPKTVSIVGTNPITQWTSGGKTPQWNKALQFLTVGDTTWVLNKEETITATVEPAGSVVHKAFYWIKKSFDNGQDEGYTYEVVLNGIKYSVNNTDSIDAADNLVSAINGDGHSSGVFARNSGSIIRMFSGAVTSNPYGAYSSIVTPYDVNNKYIAVSPNTTGSGAVQYDITDANQRASAYAKISQGEYIETSVGYKNPSTFITDGTLVNGDNYIMDITYYKAGLSQPVNATRVFQIKDEPISFTFESGDSWGNQASVGWKDSVAKISDLPASMDGFTDADIGTIAITGTDKDSFTNYYLSWSTDHWKEAYKDGTKKTLNNLTLPAKITQVDSNTFSFEFNDEWESRVKGDEDSNPTPSFVDGRISNMFFFKNRLGFTSEENVIMSEAGSYYNFWATTAMEVLDSDPIDAGVDSNTVSVIRNVNATAGALTLWADNAQFLLSGGEVLSPATTRISQTSSYACDNGLSPLVVDNEIIYFNKKGNYLEALSYAPASLQADKSSAESISAHIPTYLPSTIDRVKVASAYNMMFLLDSNEGNTIYVYKYHIQGGSKVISAWFTWTSAESIKEIEVLDNELFILANSNDILKISLEPQSIGGSFRDRGTVNYASEVIMSKYNVQTRQETQTIREPFYIKSLKVARQGDIDLDIINEERANTKTVKTKHLDRKLVIGGNSDKVKVGFSTSYDTGCELDTINIEGRLRSKSQNV